MAKQYLMQAPFRAPAEVAQKVGERLSELEKSSGKLRPEIVVEDARPADSLLHDFFEWDDSTAAEAHRLDQARRLIQSVKVRYSTPERQDPVEVRAFVNLRGPGWSPAEPYQDTINVLNTEVLRDQLVSNALKEADAWMARWKEFDELAGIFRAIKLARRKKTLIPAK